MKNKMKTGTDRVHRLAIRDIDMEKTLTAKQQHLLKDLQRLSGEMRSATECFDCAQEAIDTAIDRAKKGGVPLGNLKVRLQYVNTDMVDDIDELVNDISVNRRMGRS